MYWGAFEDNWDRLKTIENFELIVCERIAVLLLSDVGGGFGQI